MKKMNVKILIAIALLLVISLSSFAMLSFSLADENNGATIVSAGSSTTKGFTHIDRIVENSNEAKYGDKDPKDPNYNILEITSGSNSSLESMCGVGGVFQTKVLDGYRSVLDKSMKDGTVKYVSMSSTASDDELIAAIQDADFIYVHNDPDSMFDSSKGTDLSEAVKLALSKAATADYKPFIIDSYKATIDNIVSARKYNDLVSKVFKSNKAAYRWNKSGSSYISTNDFFNSSLSASTYLPIHGDDKADKWLKLTNGKTVAKVLTITNGSSGTALSQAMKDDLIQESSVTDPNLDSNGELYQYYEDGRDYSTCPGFRKYAYFSNEAFPDYMQFFTVDSTDLLSYDLNEFDFIVLEDTLNNVNIGDSEYSALSSAFYSRAHILYSTDLKSEATAGKTYPENPGPCYAYILDKVSTPTDTSKFGNVLLTNFYKMGVYADSPNEKGVKDIADIIINGTYRGIKGSDSGEGTSNVYTVLEIEPAYPIDTNLSKAFYDAGTYDLDDNRYTYQGLSKTFLDESLRSDSVLFGNSKHNELSFYYLRTNGVLDSTSDEISFDDGNTSLSDFDNNDGTYDYNSYLNSVKAAQGKDTALLQDYYKWTLSKAKIAHAVGKDYNQVKVVHMSSAEFNSSRVACADAYDAIYIGGDTSAMKKKSSWTLDGGKYNMYFADGDYGGQITTSTGTFRSNDISNKKRDELIKYAEHLPIIIDKSVKTAMDNDEGVSKNSNMYKVIDSVKSAPLTLYGFDSTKTIKIENPDDIYGTTYGGYVTVFNGSSISQDYKGIDNTPYINNGNHNEDEDALSKCLGNAHRPKLDLTSMPKLYVETDSSTWITKNDFKWEYSIKDNVGEIHAAVFVDDNANGQFEETEERGSASGTESTVDPTKRKDWIGDDYFGPVYWKFVATDEKTGASVSVTGISKIYRQNQPKMHVDLLQITPCPDVPADQDKSTLFLCTDCQMSRTIIKSGNITTGQNAGKYGKQTLETLSERMSDTLDLPKCTNGETNKILKIEDPSSNTRPDSINVTYRNAWWQENGNTNISKGSSVNVAWNNKNASPFHVENGSGQTMAVTYDGVTQYGSSVDVNAGRGSLISVKYLSDEETALFNKKPLGILLQDKDSSFNYAEHGNSLGIHTHKFGICKYDAHETRHNPKNECEYEGLDDLNSNWFLDFQNDYDVETVIWSVEDYQNYCLAVEDVYKDCKTSDEVETVRETYSSDAKDFEIYYRCMKAVINGDYSSTPYITPDERTKFKDYLEKELKIGATYDSSTFNIEYTSNPDSTDVTNMLNAFAGSSGEIDKWLLDPAQFKVTIAADGTKTYDGILPNEQKLNCYKEQLEKEINFYTDSSINPSDRSYNQFFSLWSDQNEKVSTEYAKRYVIWRDAKILEAYFYMKYKENKVYSAVYYGDNVKADKLGKFKLDDAFNCICLGAADDFNNKDINKRGCEILEDYAENDGSLILFHDSLVPNGIVGGAGTDNISAILSDDFGQGKISDSATIGKGKYSLTQRSLMYASEGNESNNYYKPLQKNNYTYKGLETNNQTLHGSFDLRDAVNGKNGTGTPATSNKANQINEGVITEYPFTIDSTLTISATASSGYTANVDESEMVVYYTISGGLQGTASSSYAADPNNGANNYFLYQYNNVTYTGAGHSLITGVGRENNDERRLFINVILNSARKSTAGPSLTLHDTSSTDEIQTNKTIIETHEKEDGNASEDAEEYKTYVNSYNDIPEFTFRPVSSSGIKTVEIWYDVRNKGEEKNSPDYTADADGLKDIPIFYASLDDGDDLSGNHIGSELVKRIYTETSPIQLKGTVVDPVSGDITNTNLQLKQEYFTGRGNKCTYITVKVTDKKDRPVIKTIRVELKPDLLDLN